MSTDEIIAQIESEQARKRVAKMAILQHEDAIEILKLKLKNSAESPKIKVAATRKQKFIEKYNPEIDVLEFISKAERKTAEVADFLGLDKQVVGRRCIGDNPMYLPGLSNTKATRWIDTISVAETLFNAETDQK